MPAFKVYMGASDLAGAVNRTLTVQLGSAMPVTEALLAEDLVSEDTYNAKDGDRVRICFKTMMTARRRCSASRFISRPR